MTTVDSRVRSLGQDKKILVGRQTGGIARLQVKLTDLVKFLNVTGNILDILHEMPVQGGLWKRHLVRGDSEVDGLGVSHR